jgi:predicted Zn-dependent protease
MDAPIPIQPLAAKDTEHLQLAYGFLGAGNYTAAARQLDQIAPDCWEHPGVLTARLSLAHQTKQWAACLELVEALIAGQPQNPIFWVHRATFLRELGRLQEAWDGLLPGVERFPKFWMVPYTLACLACVLGRQDEAVRLLRRAAELVDPQSLKAKALAESDLEPLWASIAQM